MYNTFIVCMREKGRKEHFGVVLRFVYIYIYMHSGRLCLLEFRHHAITALPQTIHSVVTTGHEQSYIYIYIYRGSRAIHNNCVYHGPWTCSDTIAALISTSAAFTSRAVSFVAPTRLRDASASIRPFSPLPPRVTARNAQYTD